MAGEAPEAAPEGSMMAGTVLLGFIQVCFKLIYPSLVLILMFTPDVKAALGGTPANPAQEG